MSGKTFEEASTSVLRELEVSLSRIRSFSLTYAKWPGIATTNAKLGRELELVAEKILEHQLAVAGLQLGAQYVSQHVSGRHAHGIRKSMRSEIALRRAEIQALDPHGLARAGLRYVKVKGRGPTPQLVDNFRTMVGSFVDLHTAKATGAGHLDIAGPRAEAALTWVLYRTEELAFGTLKGPVRRNPDLAAIGLGHADYAELLGARLGVALRAQRAARAEHGSAKLTAYRGTRIPLDLPVQPPGVWHLHFPATAQRHAAIAREVAIAAQSRTGSAAAELMTYAKLEALEAQREAAYPEAVFVHLGPANEHYAERWRTAERNASAARLAEARALAAKHIDIPSGRTDVRFGSVLAHDAHTTVLSLVYHPDSGLTQNPQWIAEPTTTWLATEIARDRQPAPKADAATGTTKTAEPTRATESAPAAAPRPKVRVVTGHVRALGGALSQVAAQNAQGLHVRVTERVLVTRFG